MIAATDPFEDHIPEHGDLALCGGCGAVNIFDFSRRQNTLRRPTPQERLGIDRNPLAQRLLGYRLNGKRPRASFVDEVGH
jgi:hypothetical protein